MSGGYPARENIFHGGLIIGRRITRKTHARREKEKGKRVMPEQNVENETIARGILRGGITTHRDARFESN